MLFFRGHIDFQCTSSVVKAVVKESIRQILARNIALLTIVVYKDTNTYII